MRFFKVLLLALALSTFSSGCYKATFVRPVPASGKVHTEWLDFFFWGLANTEHIDVRSICANGSVRRIRVSASFGTLLVTLLTAGLYSPRHLQVQCGDPQVASAKRELHR